MVVKKKVETDCVESEKESYVDQLFWKIAVKDDEEAFRILFIDFFSSLCVFAHRYIDDWNICEDIVQDTFLRIWKNRKKIEISRSGRNFLLTSVRNLCIDYLRKKESARDWHENETKDKLVQSLNDLYSHKELEQMLKLALQKLPDKVSKVFEMSRFEGKTYKEIAEERGISIKTVEAYISESLKLLRIELKDYLPFIFIFLW